LRLDNLDDVVRKTLHIAAVLGMTFVLSEILEISEHILCISDDDKEQHALTIRRSLKAALEEGILDENIRDDENDAGASSNASVVSNMLVDTRSTKKNDDSLLDYSYTFYHDTWRRVIKSLMLDSWIQDIHMHAAMAIEIRVPDNDMRDYITKVKLFQHWKGSANTIRAAKVALDIGKSFKLLGMNRHSIGVYEDAIDIWKRCKPMEGEDTVAGKERILCLSLLIL
jgi:predicted ATPase